MEYSNQIPWTNTQVRNGPFPLERYSVFSSLSDAQDYALSNAVAYPGQVITVVDGVLSTVTAYKIETNGEICAISPAINVDDLPLSAGPGIEITPAGFINAKVGDGLGVDGGGNIVLSVLTLSGGSATD